MSDANEARSDPRLSWALLALIVVGGVGLKLVAWPEPVGHHALDGSNYYQVAGHVAAGDGLQTRLSLYHQGFQSFPHDSNIYPLWPLALGYAARLIGLPTAAVLVPTLLYGLAIVLLFVLANRLSEAFAGNAARWRSAPALTIGHAAALLFALNPVFFRHTSLPYAEGLVYVAAFGSLVALDHTRTGRLGFLWAVAAGTLASAAFLARPQMLPLPFAVALAILVTAHARRDVVAATGAAVASAIGIGLWAWHLSGFVEPFSVAALLDYAAYRETPELAPFPVTMGAENWFAFVLDRLAGVQASLDPGHPNSYVRSFGVAVYLVPLALVPLALRAPRLRDAWRWARDRESRTFVATLLAGLGALAAVHLHHGTIIWEWWFHWRHGLPMVLPLTLALVVVFTIAPNWLRAVAVVLISGSVVSGAIAVRDTSEFLRFATAGPSEDESALVAWADSRARPIRLVSTKAQALAAFSQRAGYHWTVCGDDPQQTARLLSAAGADCLVLYPGEERCPGIGPLLPHLEAVASFGSLRVYAPRTAASGAPLETSG